VTNLSVLISKWNISESRMEFRNILPKKEMLVKLAEIWISNSGVIAVMQVSKHIVHQELDVPFADTRQ